MPFDGKPEAFEKVDVLSPQALLAWIEAQPADEVYCWIDHGQCLFSKYAIWLGLSDDGCAAYNELMDAYNRRGLGDIGEPFGGVAFGVPREYGAAAARLRAYIVRAK